MAKIVTLSGLGRKTKTLDEGLRCKKFELTPMRSMDDEPMYQCVDEIDEAEISGMGQPVPTGRQLKLRRKLRRKKKTTSAAARPYPKRPVGRPRGSYGERRKGYINPYTFDPVVGEDGKVKEAVTPKLKSCGSAEWYQIRKGKFENQCRCRYTCDGNGNYTDSENCNEEMPSFCSNKKR